MPQIAELLAQSHSPAITFILIPFIIFFARILDVSMGTLRVIFITRGMRVIAPLLGFIEVLVWLFVISQVMRNLSSHFIWYVAYAAGFATGTYVGLLIEKNFAVGNVIVRILTKNSCTAMSEWLQKQQYHTILLKGTDLSGDVNMLLAVVKRNDMKRVIEIIRTCDAQALYTVEDVRYASEQMIPQFVRSPRHRFFAGISRTGK